MARRREKGIAMTAHDDAHPGEMKMVTHMIYEFKKGIRSLVLCTLCPTCAEMVKQKLDNQGIGYITQQLGNRNVNLFFGEQACLEAVGSFIHKPLNLLTPEEDFMLGAMLGYDIARQSQRFCERKFKVSPLAS